MWPRAGFWVNETSLKSQLVECAAPALERCPGASNESQATGFCGEIYRGHACSRCVQGNWAPNDNSPCRACPEDNTAAAAVAAAKLVALLGECSRVISAKLRSLSALSLV